VTIPTLDDVLAAAARIGSRVHRTPVVPLDVASERGGPRLLLKLENRQRTRSFKPRGALNAALRANELGPVAGLVTFSSGNHGQAVALAGEVLGVPALVVAPEDVREVKLAAMERRGATVVRHGLTSAERMERAIAIAAERGWLLVPPYDHPDVVAGQGTMGIELAADVPRFDVACVPIGGGGLVSGIAIALAALRPEVAIVGVEPEGADDARRSLAAGSLQANEGPARTACDGLRNTRLGELNWEVVRARIQTIVTVSDEDVSAAGRALAAAGHGPVEPSGAAAAAAVLAGRVGAPGQTVVAIVSGGNVD
jgi:threonine dehydratase